MYIMNLIQDICLVRYTINNTPKWKFITKYKQVKKLNEYITDFLNLDIFSASDTLLTFLLSINKSTLNINGFLKYDNQYLSIIISDNNEVINITYYPRSNRFEIINDRVAYTIYRNTKISNHINNMWIPLTDKIRTRYLNIIIQLAEYICDWNL